MLISSIVYQSQVPFILLISLRKLSSKHLIISCFTVIAGKPRISKIDQIRRWAQILISWKSKPIRFFISKLCFFIWLCDWWKINKSQILNRFKKSQLLRLSVKISELKIRSSYFLEISKSLSVLTALVSNYVIWKKKHT